MYHIGHGTASFCTTKIIGSYRASVYVTAAVNQLNPEHVQERNHSTSILLFLYLSIDSWQEI